jgi:hypothetical protein
MKSYTTDRVRLAALHGTDEADRLIREALATGASLLPTGAKLYARTKTSLIASGYTDDGLDVIAYATIRSEVSNG